MANAKIKMKIVKTNGGGMQGNGGTGGPNDGMND